MPLTHVLRPRSLWRLAVFAFYAAFAVCYCREHHADAIALQLTSAVWHPLKARALASLLRQRCLMQVACMCVPIVAVRTRLGR